MQRVYAVLHRTDKRSTWALFCVYGEKARAEAFIDSRVKAGSARDSYKIQDRLVM